MPLNIARRTAGEVVILDLAGRATIGNDSERLGEALLAEVKRGTRKLLVNLSDLGHVDSSGLAALMRAHVSMTRSGGTMRLIVPAGRVREVFDALQLARAMTYLFDEASALASFS
jgi:anti-sigma B factor antagonist